VIALIGISLIKVSVNNWCGGVQAKDFGSMSNIARRRHAGGDCIIELCEEPLVALSSVVVGIAVGCIAAALAGKFHFNGLGDTWFRLPALFPFGFQFNGAIFLPVALVSLVCILEAVGDLTANCLISHQPIDDSAFRSRLKGGILADGISCMIAAMLCAFPNTTFAQNNGVIQMTGVASRFVGRYIGVILILLGLFPPFGEIAPDPTAGTGRRDHGDVWLRGGGGIRIITQNPLTRRDMLIVGLAFGFGYGRRSCTRFSCPFPGDYR
jgi:xanthine permease XanP